MCLLCRWWQQCQERFPVGTAPPPFPRLKVLAGVPACFPGSFWNTSGYNISTGYHCSQLCWHLNFSIHEHLGLVPPWFTSTPRSPGPTSGWEYAGPEMSPSPACTSPCTPEPSTWLAAWPPHLESSICPLRALLLAFWDWPMFPVLRLWLDIPRALSVSLLALLDLSAFCPDI